MEPPFYNDIGRYKVKRERNSFKTPLDVRVVDGGKRFMLLHQFTYHWGVTKITVPAGFVTDFASIPRIFRIIIPKLGKWNKAAVVHDYLYQHHGKHCRGWAILFYMTRRKADIIFHDAMKDLGVKEWERTLMYWAVRLGGWAAWRKR